MFLDVLPAPVFVHHVSLGPEEVRRRHQILRNWSYRWLLAAM